MEGEFALAPTRALLQCTSSPSDPPGLGSDAGDFSLLHCQAHKAHWTWNVLLCVNNPVLSLPPTAFRQTFYLEIILDLEIQVWCNFPWPPVYSCGHCQGGEWAQVEYSYPGTGVTQSFFSNSILLCPKTHSKQPSGNLLSCLPCFFWSVPSCLSWPWLWKRTDHVSQVSVWVCMMFSRD